MTNEISNDNNYEKIIQSQNRHHKKDIIVKKNSARFNSDIVDAEDFIFSSGISCSVLNRIENSLSRF